MSVNFYQNDPRRLRSPLLGFPAKIDDAEEDSNSNSNNKNNNKSKNKKTYYNSNEEVEKTLDTTLFNNTEKKLEKITVQSNIEKVNIKQIDILITTFKAISIFILATGSMLSLLEFINVIRTLYAGSLNFGNSLIVFTTAFIGTLLANAICLGFIHLIKITKYLYLNCENLKNALVK